MSENLPPVGHVRYMLDEDWLDHGGFNVVRVEVVGQFATREEARQWMVETTEQRQARDGGTHVGS